MVKEQDPRRNAKHLGQQTTPPLPTSTFHLLEYTISNLEVEPRAHVLIFTSRFFQAKGVRQLRGFRNWSVKTYPFFRNLLLDGQPFDLRQPMQVTN